MLRLDSVSRHFGGLAAVNRVSFSVEAGQVVGLIGPNGAGKTTLLNLVSGLDRVTSGEVYFDQFPIHKLPPHKINQLGIARTYQNIRLFAEMSVRENLIVGMHTQGRAGLLSATLMLPAYRAEERRLAEEADALAVRLGLDAFRDSPADALSYGDRVNAFEELAQVLTEDRATAEEVAS